MVCLGHGVFREFFENLIRGGNKDGGAAHTRVGVLPPYKFRRQNAHRRLPIKAPRLAEPGTARRLRSTHDRSLFGTLVLSGLPETALQFGAGFAMRSGGWAGIRTLGDG